MSPHLVHNHRWCTHDEIKVKLLSGVFECYFKDHIRQEGILVLPERLLAGVCCCWGYGGDGDPACCCWLLCRFCWCCGDSWLLGAEVGGALGELLAKCSAHSEFGGGPIIPPPPLEAPPLPPPLSLYTT